MAVLTYQQVYALARDAGLGPAAAVIATAIAKGESGFNTDAVGDVKLQDGKWGPSIGLWQVRSLNAEKGKGTARDATRLKDPRFNAQAMVEISGMGKTWRPWSVYTNGSFQKYLGQSLTVGKTIDGDPTALDKALAGILKVPGVGAAVDAATGVGGTVATAVGDAANALNPLASWQTDAQGIVIKSLAIAVGGGLFVAGAIRLVLPAATSAARSATGL